MVTAVRREPLSLNAGEVERLFEAKGLVGGKRVRLLGGEVGLGDLSEGRMNGKFETCRLKGRRVLDLVLATADLVSLGGTSGACGRGGGGVGEDTARSSW